MPLQPPLPFDEVKAHNNTGLFADHFLNTPERLHAMQEWKQAAGLNEAFEQIASLYQQQAGRFSERTNESQTEEGFIRPVLNLLWSNACYQVQVRIPTLHEQRQPDYAFFRSPEARLEADAHLGAMDYWRTVPCLGDAKRWSASLDKKRAADDNPSAQVCNYLYRSRVRWGILTNGRVWRLYEREKSSAGGIFYEVNLEELLRHGDPEAFKYFYLFFRREAFVPDSSGVTFIEKVFQGSVDYAAEVGDRLKESVYDALRLLMNGFFEYAANGLDPHDPATLRTVHEHCLILLYRLLFLLYAEDRHLLPRSREPYKSYSLYRLQREINRHLRQGKSYPPLGRRFWGELTTLFALIDQGYPEGHIPAYNGGLFSPGKYPQIAHTPQSGAARWEIGDHRLSEVIDMLAYQRETWHESGTRDIDYTTLDVQHLGSIYEGLLELQPRLAEEALVETMEDGKPVFTPQRKASVPRPIRGQAPRTIKAGEVYLVTNRGERKASGSYYTPKYIVDYIVENTLGPLVDQASKQVETLRADVDSEINKLEKTKKRQSSSLAAKAELSHSRAIEEQQRRLLEPYLTLNILDPAMGSGHFLVGAADFLSLAMATDPNLPYLQAMGDEDPQIFYKRLVVERCLYGVDLNPLAVELAKLSLWLHTVSKDKALSFLDHHLRCGNSLIGARVEEDLMSEPPRFNARGKRVNADSQQLVFGFTQALSATHLHYFLDTFRKIMETPSGDADMERMKDALYREMDHVRDKFRGVANCWLAPYFGVPVTPEQYERAVSILRAAEAEWQALAQEQWFQEAQTVAGDKRCFHWELEFPEIFFEAQGFKLEQDRGFDAVIGNPPYVRSVRLKDVDAEAWTYYSDLYAAAAKREFDIYLCFAEQGLHLTDSSGLLGMIMPNKWFTTQVGKLLRSLLVKQQVVEHIVDFGHFQVFSEATTYTCLLFLKGKICDQLKVDVLETADEKAQPLPGSDGKWQTGAVSFKDLGEEAWNVSLGTAKSLLQKIADFSKLKDIATVFSGTGTRADSIFLMERQGNFFYSRSLKQWVEIESELMRPSLTGRNIDPYYYESNNYLLFPYRFVDEEVNLISPEEMAVHYPKAWMYLNQPTNRNTLEERDRGKFRGRPDWYCHSYPRNMFFLGLPKLVLPDVAGRAKFACDFEGRYIIDTVYGIRLKENTHLSLLTLTAILNSSLMTFFLQQTGTNLRGGYFRMKTAYLNPFPVPHITFTTPDKERSQLLEEAKQLYEQYLSQGDSDSVLEFVAQQLSHTPERADVIHDLLAWLAEQMIAMNKEKQEEITGFLKWLERHIGAKVDDLSNKTGIRAYHDSDLDTLLKILRKNRRKLSVNPTTRAAQEPIETEFNASMTTLTPLKATIAATDRLIDLIVYKLYGLTAEEIALVEGNPIQQ